LTLFLVVSAPYTAQITGNVGWKKMKRIDLQSSVEVVQGPNGPRFRGPALALRELASSLRTLRDAPLGLICQVGSIELYVTDDPNDPH
jgi:hypothetical protein